MFRRTLLRPLPRLLPHPLTRPHAPPQRPLSSTVPALKKASKPAKGDHHHTPSNELPPPAGAFDFDSHFSVLEADLARILDRLKDDLSKLRTSRVDPALYEAVPVALDAATKTPLRDIAHVVAKGRSVVVGVYEEENVKKVMRALQNADLNVTPLVDAKAPTQLVLPLPPPTREARGVVAAAAAKAGERAAGLLRARRGESHRLIKGLKGVRPDDVRRADRQLEKVMEKAGAEAKRVVEGARKAIMEA